MEFVFDSFRHNYLQPNYKPHFARANHRSITILCITDRSRLELEVGHYKKHKACPCPINQYLSQLRTTVLQNFDLLHVFQAITEQQTSQTFKTLKEV